MEHAIAELGVTEIHGPDNNSRIMEYARVAGVGSIYLSDETDWSGSFLAFVLKTAGFDQLPQNPLLNSSWAQWGKGIEQPKFGAIAVFSSAGIVAGGGHVGFVVGDEDDKRTLSILGGNQSDSVSVRKMPKERLLALRLPPIP
jgi:uncharacterized protein (TIGR02594 family)